MNRPLIITIGIVFILIVSGLWVYLLFFGTPEDPDEIFTNFGFDITPQETTITPPPIIEPPVTTIDTTSEALRQLTTRPVAGFAFGTGSSSNSVLYAERGTGHIYEIDLTTGIESPLSRTTLPQVAEAVFSPSGQTVALTSYTRYSTSVFVGTIGEAVNLSGIELPPGARNISFSSDTDVLYTITQNGTTIGYRHNIETFSRSEVFSFNFSNLDVAWGPDLEKIYLSTKPAHDLEGHIYTTENNILTPVAQSAFGLSALFSNSHIILTSAHSGIYTSDARSPENVNFNLPVLALKEKCVFDTFATTVLWCAAPLSTNETGFVENWYKGVRDSEDHLWFIDIQKGEAQLYADFKGLSGRLIDVSAITMSAAGDALSFTNKRDHTLWLYDLTVE